MRAHLLMLCGYASQRSPVAVLNAVRITKEFGYAIDPNGSLRILWDGPDVDVCIDATLLANALNGIPDDQRLEFVPGDGFVYLKAGRRKLKLRTVPADGMQELTVSGDPCKLPAPDVVAAIKIASAAVAVRDHRMNLKCVSVEVSTGSTLVRGTDGFRAHVGKLKNDLSLDGTSRHLIPPPVVKRLFDLAKVGGELTLYPSRAVLVKGDITFTGVLHADTYPNFPVNMFDTDGHVARVSGCRLAMSHALDSAVRLGMTTVTLAIDGSDVCLRGENQGDEFEQEVIADVSGANTSVNFNPVYLADALRVVDDVFVMHVGSQAKPLVLRSNEVTALVQGTRK